MSGERNSVALLMRALTLINPMMSVGKLIASVACEHPTPYAWLGVATDQELMESIGHKALHLETLTSSDNTSARDVINMLEAKFAEADGMRFGQVLQGLVDATTPKAPASLPDSNHALLSCFSR
jgi:hypothetical protein